MYRALCSATAEREIGRYQLRRMIAHGDLVRQLRINALGRRAALAELEQGRR